MNLILNSYCNLTCNYCFADEYKEVNSISMARMGSRFLTTVFEKTDVKEPCKSCPHYMVRCSSGCFAYNFVDEKIEEPVTAK